MYCQTRKRITVFTGHYGSGKTEIAVNCALEAGGTLGQLTLIDLDFVNPYFRSREARGLLEEKGIKVIASTEEVFNTDIPAFSRSIGGAIGNEEGSVIVDLGGDETGARAIGRFRNIIKNDDYDLLFVVNPFRPFTSKPEEIKKIIKQVENSSGLKVTALVSNPNLINETKVSNIVNGHEVVTDTSDMLGIEIRFLAVEQSFAHEPRILNLKVPVLSIIRRMTVPWEQSL